MVSQTQNSDAPVDGMQRATGSPRPLASRKRREGRCADQERRAVGRVQVHRPRGGWWEVGRWPRRLRRRSRRSGRRCSHVVVGRRRRSGGHGLLMRRDGSLRESKLASAVGVQARSGGKRRRRGEGLLLAMVRGGQRRRQRADHIVRGRDHDDVGGPIGGGMGHRVHGGGEAVGGLRSTVRWTVRRRSGVGGLWPAATVLGCVHRVVVGALLCLGVLGGVPVGCRGAVVGVARPAIVLSRRPRLWARPAGRAGVRVVMRVADSRAGVVAMWAAVGRKAAVRRRAVV
mmetsp:Transcript_20451/g.78583  ORF Transcript_20451/g.78583 Transcript_20451/m.78583 type:complete len:286 (+) Transcript_20451:141-998(+)